MGRKAADIPSLPLSSIVRSIVSGIGAWRRRAVWLPRPLVRGRCAGAGTGDVDTWEAVAGCSSSLDISTISAPGGGGCFLSGRGGMSGRFAFAL